MKKSWGVAVAVTAAFTLAGCGGGSDGSAASSAPTKAAAVHHTLHEKAFLSVVHEQFGNHGDVVDEDTIKTGRSICAGYAAGMSWVKMLATLHDAAGNTYTGKQLGELMGASTAAFCPEYNDKAPGS